VLRVVSAAKLLDGLAALPGAQDAGAADEGIAHSLMLAGVEYAQATAIEESRLRSTWRRRVGGGATPLVLFGEDPEQEGFVRVLGPDRNGPLRRVRHESLLELAHRTLSFKRRQAVQILIEDLDRLDAERVPGLRVRGLGTEHLYRTRLEQSDRWPELVELVEHVNRAGWRELLGDLGYSIEPLEPSGYLAKFEDRPVIVVYPRAKAWLFSRIDEQGRLPEGALVARCRKLGAPYGILAAGPRLRLLAAGPEEAGAATRYLELDAGALDPDRRPLLGLLAPRYLADGEFRGVLEEARDYGQDLRLRLDRVLRQRVLPILGLELGRWAQREGRDLRDELVRGELESAARLFVFRSLFLLYGESANHLPMTNPTYRAKSLTRVCDRAYEEQDVADPKAGSLWDDVSALVRRMRTGQTAWELPAYNGDLFAADRIQGAPTLEIATIPDAELGPALIALGRDEEKPEVGVDFSSLEIGHLGYIYEGLLSLRLSLADRDYSYSEREDRYVKPTPDSEPDVHAGELLWLTNEGGRKSAGVYYTRTDLVRHLVRGAVGPAFDRHIELVRAIAERDPAAAAEKLFDFFVLDPACGSAHFLVETVDELADKIAALLGEITLPIVQEQLEHLRRQASIYGAGAEDAALLKRLVLKRCIYGVDLSAMGVEIAKVSLWLATFVPGLSLAYLNHNVQHGNSLIGVARASDVGQDTLFGHSLASALDAAARAAAELRSIDDTTPDQVAASRAAHEDLREQEAGAQRLFNLWTAEPLGMIGARDEALRHGSEVLAGASSPSAKAADELAEHESFLHWPMAFPEVFARESPGFDAVVGNPPWRELEVDSLTTLSQARPGLRGLSQRERDNAVAELLDKRPELVEKIDVERKHAEVTREYFGQDTGYESLGAKKDLYRLFAQRYRRLICGEGSLGVVLPRTTFLDQGASPFRRWLLDHASPERIDFLVNRGRWAFDIHPQYSVSLVVARRGQAREAIGVAGVADSAKAFAAQTSSPALQLVREVLGPGLEIPLLPNQAAADLLARLPTEDRFPEGGGRWQCFPVQGDFNETLDKRLWKDATSGRPLWKGESFDQFNPNGNEERPCPASPQALEKQDKPQPGKESLLAKTTTRKQRRTALRRTVGRARVAFRGVSRATDSRTVRASLIPPLHFLTYKAPYLVFMDDDPRAEAGCLGLMNSLPFDWQARRYVEIDLNFFILELLAVPQLGDEDFQAIAIAAARLSCPDGRFKDFAATTGVECGPLDPIERLALRADIDARVARAWSLTPEELEVVFSDFTQAAVGEDYRDRVRLRFTELG
jgi:hypothetical protein